MDIDQLFSPVAERPPATRLRPPVSPEFARWFRGSKVVDARGNPLVCFHGTFEGFSRFKLDSERRRAHGTNRLGFWFDARPETPDYFAGYMGHGHPQATGRQPVRGGNVMPCYLRVVRPLVFASEPLWQEDAERLRAAAAKRNWGEFNRLSHEEGGIDRRDAYDHMMQFIGYDARHVEPRNRPRFLGSKDWEARVEAFRKQCEVEGYDGIHLQDTLVDGGSRGGRSTDWWIVFRSNQIKSAISARQFDPASDDITETRAAAKSMGALPEGVEPPPGVRLRTDHHGVRHGQHDMSILAFAPDGSTVGTLDYSVFEGKPAVKMLDVAPKWRRRGVATAMLRDLQRQHPDAEIALGMLTGDGAALHARLPFEEVPDEPVRRKLDLLAGLRRRLAELEGGFSKMPHADPAALETLNARWSRLSWRVENLERELHDTRPTKRLIR